MLPKDRELNNLHKFVGWASRPPFLDGRDAHPTRTIKIVSYLILIPKLIKPLTYGSYRNFTPLQRVISLRSTVATKIRGSLIIEWIGFNPIGCREQSS